VFLPHLQFLKQTGDDLTTFFGGVRDMSDTELLVKSEPPRRLEVFTGAGRRRSWTPEQKAQIVAECNADGGSVSAIARRHGLTPQEVFGWRRDVRRQAEETSNGITFAPVMMECGAPISPAALEPRLIEVVIGMVTVRIPLGAVSATLEAVVRAVKAAI
jgi:transposase